MRQKKKSGTEKQKSNPKLRSDMRIFELHDFPTVTNAAVLKFHVYNTVILKFHVLDAAILKFLVFKKI